MMHANQRVTKYIVYGKSKYYYLLNECSRDITESDIINHILDL